jgi:NAD+ synthase (glutamine-hydrolysing)
MERSTNIDFITSVTQTPNVLRVGGAALNQTPLDWCHNTANILEAIRQAKEVGIRLLCLPELTITGYGCEDLFLSDWVYEQAFAELLKLLPHTVDLAVIIGLPFLHQDVKYNGAALLSNGALVSIRLKMFLPKEGVHYEPRWFEPWPAGKTDLITKAGHSFEIGDVVPTFTLAKQTYQLGFEICEDAWQDDRRPAIQLGQDGIRLVANPSASHFSFGKQQERFDLVTEGSRLVDGLYIYVNQLGNEAGRIIYDGDVIIGFRGQVVCSGPRLGYHLVSLAWVDVIDQSSIGHVSHPADHNANTSKEEEFTAAACLGLYDYLRKSRARNYVLSLSGGADSSTCAVLVAEFVKRGMQELGAVSFGQNLQLSIEADTPIHQIVNQLLITAYQSTRNSGPATLEAAEQLANSLGAQFHHWAVDDTVVRISETMAKTMGRSLNWEQDDIALQNVQARARSPYIWMLTNLSGGLLLTTSNRSEGDVGYATMDGDTSGSLAPIAGIDKDFIRHWLCWAEHHLGYHGLRFVNGLEPTAELRPAENAQTDEKDLMPYSLLAAIERFAIKERKSPRLVYETLLSRADYTPEVIKTSVLRFYRLWTRNQWKRERLAPSFHLDDFNIDPRSWCRFPILSSGFSQELAEIDAL